VGCPMAECAFPHRVSPSLLCIAPGGRESVNGIAQVPQLPVSQDGKGMAASVTS